LTKRSTTSPSGHQVRRKATKCRRPLYAIAVIYANKKKEYAKAESVYTKLAMSFPDDATAASAAYQRARILAQHLKKPDSAIVAYEYCLKRYRGDLRFSRSVGIERTHKTIQTLRSKPLDARLTPIPPASGRRTTRQHGVCVHGLWWKDSSPDFTRAVSRVQCRIYRAPGPTCPATRSSISTGRHTGRRTATTSRSSKRKPTSNRTSSWTPAVSMEYGSPGQLKKIEYASYVAAALGYLMVEQRDAVGLTIYDEQVRCGCSHACGETLSPADSPRTRKPQNRQQNRHGGCPSSGCGAHQATRARGCLKRPFSTIRGKSPQL